MTPFSYLSVLTSIVLALGITRILTGFGRLLQVRWSISHYWVHFVWGLNVFIYQVLLWWILFRWQSQVEWSFFLYLFVLLSPTITFLLAVLLIPDPFIDGINLKQHYYANHRWFFALAALLAPLDAIDTLLKGVEHFTAQGPIYVVTIGTITILSIIAALTKREKFHAFFAVFFLIYILAFIAINLRVLN